MSSKDMKFLSFIIAFWGIIFIGSGLVMNKTYKPKEKIRYSLNIEEKIISQAQAKTNEIKLKDLEIEINNPISMNIEDYLENISNIEMSVLKVLKLDTSLVNITQAGTYQYTITYNKKKYIGTIKIKEKELPNVTFTLINLTLTTGDAVPTNPRNYIKEEITEEVYNNITLDISKVNNQVQGNYEYFIKYNGTIYKGEIAYRNPGPTIITPSTSPAPSDDPNVNLIPEQTEIVQ
jgi:predicted transcriptional regulator